VPALKSVNVVSAANAVNAASAPRAARCGRVFGVRIIWNLLACDRAIDAAAGLAHSTRRGVVYVGADVMVLLLRYKDRRTDVPSRKPSNGDLDMTRVKAPLQHA
jgi:hypothetical protein